MRNLLYLCELFARWEKNINIGASIALCFVGKKEALIELLEEKGSLSNELCETIKNQKDKAILSAWLKLAWKVESIEEFQQKIG